AMLLSPRRTWWATGAADERFHVVRVNGKSRGRLCGFDATAAQAYREAEVARRTAQRELIHHPVRRALQRIRLPDRSNRFGECGERGLADRENADGVRRPQIVDDAAQRT